MLPNSTVDSESFRRIVEKKKRKKNDQKRSFDKILDDGICMILKTNLVK